MSEVAEVEQVAGRGPIRIAHSRTISRLTNATTALGKLAELDRSLARRSVSDEPSTQLCEVFALTGS